MTKMHLNNNYRSDIYSKHVWNVVGKARFSLSEGSSTIANPRRYCKQ